MAAAASGGAAAPRGGSGRSEAAVERYLTALGAYAYDVQIVRPDGTAERRPGLSPGQLRAQLPRLRRENARGGHIYARPAGTGYLLLDDLPAAQLPRMREDGLEPAVVLETSRGNLAAWIKIGSGLDAEQASAAAATLARRYGADPRSTDAQHLSRLPGFTNQKPERRTDEGFAPFVLVRDAWGGICRQADALKSWAREVVEVRRREAAIGRADPVADVRPAPDVDPADAYRRLASAARKRDPEGTKDRSQLDYRVAQDMARRSFKEDQIAAAITAASPHIAERKTGHVEDYAERTASNAVQSVRPSKPVHDRQAAQEARESGATIDPDDDTQPAMLTRKPRRSESDFSPGF